MLDALCISSVAALAATAEHTAENTIINQSIVTSDTTGF